MCGAMLGLHHATLTPYSIRRGGATWHFATFGSLDLTQHLGRWSSQRITKVYIDDAMVAMAASRVTVPEANVARAIAALQYFANMVE